MPKFAVASLWVLERFKNVLASGVVVTSHNNSKWVWAELEVKSWQQLADLFQAACPRRLSRVKVENV